MQALIKSKLELKMTNFDNLNYQVKEKSTNSELGLDFKFYQTLFVLILTSCALLIFPESPKNSEVLCRKHHSVEACSTW